MKKTTYALALITVILLIGCGNTASSDTSSDALADAALSGEVNDMPATDETQQSQSDNDKSVITSADTAKNEETSDKSTIENYSQDTGVQTENDTDVDNSGKNRKTDNNNNTNNIDNSNNSDNSDNNDNDNNNDNDKDNKNNESKLSEYTVTSFEESKTMYATGSVNIRKGPSTDFNIIGGLKRGQEITVTGQADTGWYEIQYNENKAFVSNKYLQDEKPVDEPAAVPEADAGADAQQNPDTQTPSPETGAPSLEADTVQPVTEVKNVAGVILVGDSRFVQMQNSVGENPCTWIAEVSKGYNWFNDKAIARIDSCVGKGSKILINLGVNDTGNLQKYISLVNAKADEWVGKGATVYYSSVNPVWENPYVTEEQVEYFNSQMQASLNSNVHWIDSHSYLISTGYRLVDGLHYSTETYQNLYAYYMSCL